MIVNIRDDEHVFICGMTGTGKSVLAEVYLAGFNHVVKLDTKGEYYERVRDDKPIWRGLVQDRDYTVIFKLEDIDKVKTPKIVYVPDEEEMDLEHYNALMDWVYKRENTTLWIDELMEVAPSPTKYPPKLKALYTRGRSKRATVWACTQRPSDIPAICISQSNHYFIFALQLPQDREKIAKGTGQADFLDSPKGYNFIYYKAGNENTVLGVMRL